MDEYSLQELAYNRGFEDGKKSVETTNGFTYRAPCKLGDIIYVPVHKGYRKYVVAYMVMSFYIEPNGVTICCKSYERPSVRRFKASEIGSVFFLNEDEALEALHK